MEGNSNNSSMAPFVLKTYDMVNDPFTELWIVWGKSNNSFIVMDPSEFSQRILPVYFKHNNFSSFIRQLNTYGFRKVDTDRWEFAHESFLRGQKHLLTNVVRKKSCNKSSSNYPYMVQAEEEQELLLMEVGRLKREQEILNEEVEAIDKRLRTTERRPEQMLAFLSKVVNDPEILTRMVQEKEGKNVIIREKKRRFVQLSASASSSSTSTLGDYDHESDNYQSIARTEVIKVEDDGGFCNQEEEEGGIIRSYSTVDHHHQVALNINRPTVVVPLYGFESSQGKYHQQIEPFFYSSERGEASTIPYPFSLLESGF
ncbi:hypothetical protein MKW94_018490 [Papaver nudicaule]|uniref:HSF-type DNA-binding domain-containing protein n=1 Tax=Papaver nudicaule TaxID=74823 RepID=A0AA41VB21_PAPNU|nr:hypothetical protein [Papaver nudicaule]